MYAQRRAQRRSAQPRETACNQQPFCWAHTANIMVCRSVQAAEHSMLLPHASHVPAVDSAAVLAVAAAASRISISPAAVTAAASRISISSTAVAAAVLAVAASASRVVIDRAGRCRGGRLGGRPRRRSCRLQDHDLAGCRRCRRLQDIDIAGV
jgi:hypothetical protein